MITFDYSSSYRKGKLVCDDPTVFNFIRNHFSIENKDAKHINKKIQLKGGGRKIPERKYLIGDSGLYPMGMTNDIRKFLIDSQFIDIEYSEEFRKHTNLGNTSICAQNSLNFDLRPYQADVVTACLQNGLGTIVVGTGGGKSLLQASLVEDWKSQIDKDAKCLIIVPGISLVEQLLHDFEDYGVTFDFSGWTGDMELQNTSVVIVNSELFHNQFSDNPWIMNVNLLLTDEVHKVRDGRVLTKLISKIKTPHKFGFTGTLPKEKEDVWKIKGTFGDVIYEKSSKELRDEKYLSNVKVHIFNIDHKIKPFKFYKDELEYVNENELRNSFICKLALKLKNNTLIMVNRLDHGDELLRLFDIFSHDKYVSFIKGEVEVSKRRELIAHMENHDDVVCVAMSSIFSTGINIKNLHNIIFTNGGKAFIRTIQSVGRGLRLHENKKRLEIFDICDKLKYSERHLIERKTFYDDEQIEWEEKIINF